MTTQTCRAGPKLFLKFEPISGVSQNKIYKVVVKLIQKYTLNDFVISAKRTHRKIKCALLQNYR